MTTLNPTSASPDLAALQTQLLSRFDRFRKRVRGFIVLEGVARVFAEIVGLALLSLILDRIFRLGLASRLVFTVLSLAFVAWETWRHIFRPLKLRLDPVDLATALDRGHRNGNVTIAARVASVLQLPDLLQSDRPPSEPMIRRAVQRSYQSLEKIDFDASLDRRRPGLALAAIVGVALVPLLVAVA